MIKNIYEWCISLSHNGLEENLSEGRLFPSKINYYEESA